MGKKVKSAKGEIIDFDYLKIKAQLAAAPTPVEVKNRQNFIENRLKRRLKKKLPVVEQLAVEVAPILPAAEENLPATEAVVTNNVVADTPPTTKQKARKKKTIKNKE